VLSFSVVDRRTAVPTTPLNEPRKKQRGNFKPPLRAVAADELDQRREMESDCYHLLTSRRVKQKMIPVWKPAQRMSRKGLIRAPLPGCSVYCRACIPTPLLLIILLPRVRSELALATLRRGGLGNVLLHLPPDGIPEYFSNHSLPLAPCFPYPIAISDEILTVWADTNCLRVSGGEHVHVALCDEPITVVAGWHISLS